MYRAVEDSKIHKLLMQTASLSIVSTDSQATNLGKEKSAESRHGIHHCNQSGHDMTFATAIKLHEHCLLLQFAQQCTKA
jgi:hypothetical protein